MRTKLIVLSISAIVILILTYLIYLSIPSDKKGNNIRLRNEPQSEYTIDDMIKSVKEEKGKPTRDPYGSSSPNISNDSLDVSIEKIRELIRENESSNGTKEVSSAVAKQPRKRKTSPLKKTKEKSTDDSVKSQRRRTFNSINLNKENKTNVIKAFVHTTQTVMLGSTLKMQIGEKCYTDNGYTIEKGAPVYGEVTAIDGERIIIKITTINVNNNILPFKKNVYSKDAIEGIYVPGNPKSDIATDASSAAVQGSNLNLTGGYGMGSQLITGAANSVINATQSASSRNLKKIKVTIKTNYQVLLMEDEE